MGLNDLTILTHTHTDCNDIWAPYFDSYAQFFNHDNHIVLVNQESIVIPHKQIVYDEKTPHSDRFILALKNIKTEFVLISMEDMFLYDTVNTSELERVIDIMARNKSLLYTRLIKSGIHTSIPYVYDKIFKTGKTDFLFSITPTIWDKDLLVETLSHLTGLSIWSLENSGDALLRNQGTQGLYYYNNERKRGGHHDSSIYPHICSAIFKGKWNVGEYVKELTPIIDKYKINMDVRGYF